MEEVNNVKFALGSISRCKWGISSLALYSLTQIPLNVDWNLACDLLKDISLFNKFSKEDNYLAYVMSKAIGAPLIVANKTNFNEYGESNNFGAYLMSLEEIKFLKEVYIRLIDEAILNILDYQTIFYVVIDIKFEKIEKMYQNLPYEMHIKRICELIPTFFQYNNFIGVITFCMPKGDDTLRIVFQQENFS
ncbi:MAG: hypothetical protein IJ809_05265 [Clostridia bacterium]|nr:hypothetical protein [Clostridia bacterium]